MSTQSNLLRRLILLGTPLAFAVLTTLHPTTGAGPGDPSLPVARWLTVHGLQVSSPSSSRTASGSCSTASTNGPATAARVALPVFLVFFSTFDAVAGLATGWLHHTANGQSGAEQAATLRAADELFNHNWLTGNLSIAGSVTAIAWAVIAIAGAVALRQAGADRLTVGLMAASLLFVNHPVPREPWACSHCSPPHSGGTAAAGSSPPGRGPSDSYGQPGGSSPPLGWVSGLGSEPQRERRVDLEVAQQEGALVEPLPPQPAGDLVVALAGVAGAAGRHDVVERVAPAAGERQHAVALQRLVGRAAVRAATPRRLERGPLLVAEVVLDAIHPALASAGGPGLATSIDRHRRQRR